MITTTEKTTVMTPEERRRLIEAPICIQTFGSQKSWSGTAVNDHGAKDRYYGSVSKKPGLGSEPNYNYYEE